MIATLMKAEPYIDLIGAARRLCRALDDMLSGIGPDSKMPRKDVLLLCSNVGETNQQILSQLCNLDEFDRETYDALLKLAKGIATCAASLILQAKDVANQVEEQNPEVKNRIISSGRQLALSSNQLVGLTKVVAPTIKNSTCQRQLTDTCREVGKQVDNLINDCYAVPDEIRLDGLKEGESFFKRNFI
jgi:talin